MIKYSLFVALMLLSLSVISQANPLTRRFIVELEHNTDSPNQNFSVKPDGHILSDNLPDIAGKNDYAETVLSSDDKRQRPEEYGVKRSLLDRFHGNGFTQQISWLHTNSSRSQETPVKAPTIVHGYL
ncbi:MULTISPECIES: hypothetical protein [unclassified Endozoicomonas]|uniref:hypothetical protein n=1 Tax=unclassified Endozoicomonas TaxID=2644528 RepID=UPI003BB58CB2